MREYIMVEFILMLFSFAIACILSGNMYLIAFIVVLGLFSIRNWIRYKNGRFKDL